MTKRKLAEMHNKSKWHFALYVLQDQDGWDEDILQKAQDDLLMLADRAHAELWVECEKQFMAAISGES
jgi:acetone carboxylase gamma subunit